MVSFVPPRHGEENPWQSDTVIIGLYNYVLHLCKRRLRDLEQVEDAAQEVMLRLLLLHRRYNPQCSLHGWARSVAQNVLREFIRHQILHSLRTLPDQILDQTVVDSKGHEPPTLLIFLDRLTTQQRRAVELRCLDGLSLSEIATEMHCRRTTAKVHLQRGKKRLRQLMTSWQRQSE